MNMATATMTSNVNVSGGDRISDTMSINNIISPPATAAAPDIVSDAPALAPPSTPAKDSPAQKAEPQSPDAVKADISPSSVEGDSEDVPDSEREFICKNDETSRCVTGQYTMDLSRKVISDHFGRNKACTRDIADWPLFCRKHYQRATYNKELWQIRKLNLIHRQFDIIEHDFPGTTYDVHFKKSEEARLNEYSRKVAAGWSEDDAANAVAPHAGKHFEAPIKILRELDLDLGKNRSIDDVKTIIEQILEMITDKETDQVPSIEFLPNLPGKVASPKKKGPQTPSPKKARAPKTPSSKGTPGRVSTKGSVKKPGQQK